ncbi:hypothetical protein D4R89_10285 [bacterium]|nr:MAG: hypothetical protein D4R89_10285 [bacterium]
MSFRNICLSCSLLMMDPVKLTEMVDRRGLFDLKGILPEEGYSLPEIAVNNMKTNATRGSGRIVFPDDQKIP